MEQIGFGFGPAVSSDEAIGQCETLAAGLTEALGMPVFAIIAESYGRLLSLVASGQVQVAWLPPAVFIQAHDAYEARLLVACRRANERARYLGAFFARESDARRAPEEFRGATVAWVEVDSASGFLFPRLALMERGIDPRRFFARELFLGMHSEVVRAVATGHADLGATYLNLGLETGDTYVSPIGAGWLDAGVGVPMRPVLTTREIPNDVICVAREIPFALEEELARALQKLHRSPEGKRLVRRIFNARALDRTTMDAYAVVRAALNIGAHTSR